MAVSPIKPEQPKGLFATLARGARSALFMLLRPFGYLAFVVALAAMSATAKLLGEDHALGFFAARLNEMVRRYPEITRRGVVMAWVTWAALLVIAISPADPIDGDWDEIALLALGAAIVWRRLLADRTTR